MKELEEASKRILKMGQDADSLMDMLQKGFDKAMADPNLPADQRQKYGRIKGEIEKCVRNNDKDGLMKLQNELNIK